VKVVVLDNDRMMRDLLAMALQMRQLEALPAGTVEEAEAVLPEAQALLMDFHLGGGQDGAALARRWASEGRLPPFWLVTGTPDDPAVQALRELGQLREVVGKPFSLLLLAEAVQRSLAPFAVEPLPKPPAPAPFTTVEPAPTPASEYSSPNLGPLKELAADDQHGRGPDSDG
jgi:DNA-binding NtrC family response regulator